MYTYPARPKSAKEPLPEAADQHAATPIAPTHEPSSVGHSFSNIQVHPPQTKLAVNQPGDQYEVEADAVAEHVMSPNNSPSLQNDASPVSIQRSASGDTGSKDVSGIVSQGLSGGGQPLDKETRSFMEPRFGVNFNQVRIHTDSQASNSSEAMSAKAYAVGSDIAFQSGAYNPGSADGKQLLAHELTHVVQQGGASEDKTASRKMVQRFQAGPSGHGGIEDKGLAAAGYPVDQASQVYFGNWMRDFSQMPPSILPVVNVLSMGEFGRAVDSNMLGTYIPSEHLDNPLGGGTVEDPNLTPAQKEEEYNKLSPDQKAAYDKENAQSGQIKDAAAASGLPEYIERGKMHSKDMFTQAAQQGDNADGRQSLGNGLHAVEDYFAHSNFVEAAQYEISHGTTTPTSAANPPAPDQSKPFDPATAMGVDAAGHPKIYTGTYGSGGNETVSGLETLKTEIHSGNLAKAFAIGLLKTNGIDFSTILQKMAAKKGEESAVGQIAGEIGGDIGGLVGGLEGLYGSTGNPITGWASGEASGSAIGKGAVGAVTGEAGKIAGGAVNEIFDLATLEAIVAKLRSIEIDLDTSILGQIADSIIEEKAKAGTQKSAETAPVDPKTGQALPTHSQIAKDSPDHPNFAAASTLAQEAVTQISGAMKTLWGGRITASADPVDASAVTTLVDRYVATPESSTWWQNIVRETTAKK